MNLVAIAARGEQPFVRFPYRAAAIWRRAARSVYDALEQLRHNLPSIAVGDAEIGERCGYKRRAVQLGLQLLEALGVIFRHRRTKGEQRRIEFRIPFATKPKAEPKEPKGKIKAPFAAGGQNPPTRTFKAPVPVPPSTANPGQEQEVKAGRNPLLAAAAAAIATTSTIDDEEKIRQQEEARRRTLAMLAGKKKAGAEDPDPPGPDQTGEIPPDPPARE